MGMIKKWIGMYGIKRNQKINYFQISITLKDVSFFLLCKTSLVILSYIIMNGLCKIFYFFNLVFKFFFSVI